MLRILNCLHNTFQNKKVVKIIHNLTRENSIFRLGIEGARNASHVQSEFHYVQSSRMAFCEPVR